ncbi:hypothetical protein Aperf_G00000043681 [Anoplocephala perfoliata]
MPNSLTTGPIKDVYQKELLKILDSHKGPLAIYWEQRAISPVNLIIGSVLLKKHGVNHSFVLESSQAAASPPDVNTVFFIFYPELQIIDLIVKFLNAEFSQRQPINPSHKKDYCLITIPKISIACKSFLQGTKIFDKLAGVYDLPLLLLPIDNDLLSMEDPNCFADYSLRDKETGLFNFAKGLMKFQSVYGLFPRIRAKGPKAKRVVEMLTQMRQESMISSNTDTSTEDITTEPLNSPGQTDLLVIIDRSVDILTPCLSQLIYEGLINEIWPVMHGSVKMPQLGTESTPKRVLLNSADMLFSEIRDRNFAKVGAVLSKRTKELSGVMNEAKNSTSLSTLKQVVNQLPELRQLHASASLHMSIAEIIQEYATTENFISSYRAQQDFLNGNESDKIHPYIEERILQAAPLEEILQLICVQSFCSGGLKQHALELYMREIMQMYGPEHMMTLNNLRMLSLIEERSRLSMVARSGNSLTDGALSDDTSLAVRRTIASVSLAYENTLRRSLRLRANREPTGEKNIDSDLDQIFGGFVPISVRLMQAMALGWPTRPLLSTSSAINASNASILSTAASTAFNASRRLVAHTSTTTGGNDSFVTNLIPAVEVNEVQNTGDAGKNTSSTANSLIKNLNPGTSGESGKTIALAFVGGMTHSELASLRKVAAYEGADFIFATTGMLTWKSLINSLSDPISVATMDD